MKDPKSNTTPKDPKTKTTPSLQINSKSEVPKGKISPNRKNSPNSPNRKNSPNS